MKKCIAVFETTFETLRAEDFLRSAGIRFRPVLKPRKIGSACRMALQFGEDSLEGVRGVVERSGLALQGFYVKNDDRWEKLETA